MSHSIDLVAYGRRIGFEGPFLPEFRTLESIVECHAAAIPFENLSVLLKHPVLLDTPSLERKLVEERRGGYCFEQNGLLLAVLQQIGFDAHPMAARVRLAQPREFLPPRTHLFVRVELDDRSWMADVGVGGLSLTRPILLDTEDPQETPHETRRVVREGTKSFHQALLTEGWTDVHEFGGEEMPLVDRELANWWTSTNPNSKFSQNLMAARSDGPGARLGILNNRFTRRLNGEVVEEIVISDPEQLLEILRASFGIEFTEGTRFGSGERPWPT